MQVVKINLSLDVYTREIHDWVNSVMAEHPLGTLFHVELKYATTSAYSLGELEEQIRSCYGSLNAVITFSKTYKDVITEVDNSVGSKSASARVLEDYLLGNKDIGDKVYPEVETWLFNHFQRHRPLIQYFNQYI